MIARCFIKLELMQAVSDDEHEQLFVTNDYFQH